MDVNGITNTKPLVDKTPPVSPVKPVAAKKPGDGSEEQGVIYEKSTEQEQLQTNHSDLVAKLKAESDERTAQFRSLVEKIILKQSAASQDYDNIYRYLASGEFTVDEATKLQAQADIAEDGYWGASQTSDRIVDFAKALAANDPEKAEELKEAFKKGYEQAQETWGGELPELSQKTFDLVIEKLDAWAGELEG